MMREDARGRRVVIVADYLVNPGSALYAGITAAPGPVLDVLAMRMDRVWLPPFAPRSPQPPHPKQPRPPERAPAPGDWLPSSEAVHDPG